MDLEGAGLAIGFKVSAYNSTEDGSLAAETLEALISSGDFALMLQMLGFGTKLEEMTDIAPAQHINVVVNNNGDGDATLWSMMTITIVSGGFFTLVAVAVLITACLKMRQDNHIMLKAMDALASRSARGQSVPPRMMGRAGSDPLDIESQGGDGRSVVVTLSDSFKKSHKVLHLIPELSGEVPKLPK